MPIDPGLQPERTLLAWRRTCLAFGGASAVATRLLVGEFGAVALALGIFGVAVSVAAYVLAEARYQRMTRMLAGSSSWESGGAHIALLASAALATVLSCGAYLVVRALANA